MKVILFVSEERFTSDALCIQLVATVMHHTPYEQYFSAPDDWSQSMHNNSSPLPHKVERNDILGSAFVFYNHLLFPDFVWLCNTLCNRTSKCALSYKKLRDRTNPLHVYWSRRGSVQKVCAQPSKLFRCNTNNKVCTLLSFHLINYSKKLFIIF